MKSLESGLLSENDLFLFLDFYELTSGKCNFDFNFNRTITEEYFFREVPEHLGSFIVASGLEQFASYIEIINHGLGSKQRRWLEETAGKGFQNREFLNYLCNFSFKGDIYAVPEGTPVFPGEPVAVITGPAIDVQIFETFLLNVINYESLVATKTARLVKAAAGRRIGSSASNVIDFGGRRAHGRDAAVLAARAAFIGGAVSTSAELLAFRQYAQSFPEETTLLVDTFDTDGGINNAVTVVLEMKQRGKILRAIRLDSGDTVQISKKARKILDQELPQTRILASNNLDEFSIDDMARQNAPVDGFGVGTRMVTGANYNSNTGEGGVSALNGIYKISETMDEQGKESPLMKFTSEAKKMTLPGKKQVWRRKINGCYSGDLSRCGMKK